MSASKNAKFSKDRAQMAKHHFLYTICILFNFVVVSIYWPVIHPKTIGKHRADGPYAKVLCQYCVHTIPAIVCLINSSMTNCVLHRNMIKQITAIAVTYAIVNFVGTKAQGKPLYHFLHWDSMETPLLIAAIIAGVNMVYLAICMMDEFFKPQLVARMNNKKMQ